VEAKEEESINLHATAAAAAAAAASYQPKSNGTREKRKKATKITLLKFFCIAQKNLIKHTHTK